ncbi:hypothetical protein CDAR_187131 [Caerostris darwini]|uniref:Uncharacterized protein n=1 Tax=Caerostris darwini TaxID=1538125 RepID=A0AAV4P1Z2_9ARAC|nr:hypothetical protein CDAR_187131 [Caerostris darwini]
MDIRPQDTWNANEHCLLPPFITYSCSLTSRKHEAISAGTSKSNSDLRSSKSPQDTWDANELCLLPPFITYSCSLTSRKHEAISAGTSKSNSDLRSSKSVSCGEIITGI